MPSASEPVERLGDDERRGDAVPLVAAPALEDAAAPTTDMLGPFDPGAYLAAINRTGSGTMNSLAFWTSRMCLILAYLS